MDTTLIIAGLHGPEAGSVWRDKTVEQVIAKLPAGEYDLVEVAPDGGADGGPVISGQLWDGEAFSNPPPPAAPPAPAQVAMHKVRKAARLTPWPGADHLLAAIEAAIAELPDPSDALAAIEFEYAPNLVREGVTTQAVMAVLGMTEQQRDDLLNFAASLP